MRLLVIAIAGTVALCVAIEHVPRGAFPLAIAIGVCAWWAIRSERARTAAAHLAEARREAIARLPGLGRPTPLEVKALLARFWGPEATEALPASRRPGARFFWALVVERHTDVEVRDGREVRKTGGHIAFIDGEGRVHIEDSGNLCNHNKDASYVSVLDADGVISYHDRDPQRTLEEIHPETTALLGHPLLQFRERDPTWTGWKFRCGVGFEVTVVPAPGYAGWTARWQHERAPRDHVRLDSHPTLVAALKSVLAVAEGNVRPTVHPPPAERLLPADDAAPESAPATAPRAGAKGTASSPRPAPPRDLLQLDVGRVDDRSTVGFLVVHNGSRAGEVIRIFGEQMVLGQSPDCEISFPQDRSISKRHAVIDISESVCVISDLRSTSGTLVNGSRHWKKVLEEGDRIMIGSCHLTFTRDLVAPAPGGAPRPLS